MLCQLRYRNQAMRKRIRVSEGVYKDRSGLAATVKCNGVQKERRFALGTSLKEIQSWRNDARVALQKVAPKIGRGSFAADAARYLEGVIAMPTYAERKKHVELWVNEFGSRVRASISTPEIDSVLARWLSEGKSAGTVRHRRAVLLHLFNRLDGPDQPNPVRRAMKPALPEPEDRSVSYPVINRILAAMPDIGQGLAGKDRDDASKSKARLSVIAFVGLPHSTLKKLTADMIDWEAGTIRVPRRQKGQGARSRTLPLAEAGLAALRHFDALDCYGPFSNSALHKSWKRACKAAKVVPAPRPYDLRHSYATLVYRETGDTRAVGELLMHAPGSRMAERYSIGGVETRLRLAVGAFNKKAKRLGFMNVSSIAREGIRRRHVEEGIIEEGAGREEAREEAGRRQAPEGRGGRQYLSPP
jgi:integrase